MEAVSVVAPMQQVVDPNDPLTLEEAEQRLNALLSQAELNAWDVGDLLNKVERRGLARATFGKTTSWVTQRIPAAEGKLSTLYRYASVAATYTKEEVDKWGWYLPGQFLPPGRAVFCGDPVPATHDLNTTGPLDAQPHRAAAALLLPRSQRLAPRLPEGRSIRPW
jgi:hypothetical protein